MKFFPRALAYSLNAYLNAQISEEIVTHIKTEGKRFATVGTTAQERAKRLVDAGAGKGIAYAIGLAYTEYHINGLADILYGRIFLKAIVSPEKPRLNRLYEESTSRFREQLTTPYQFEERLNDGSFYFSYWPAVLRNPWLWSQEFAKERLGYTGVLNKDKLRDAALEVQKQNSENNRIVAGKLREGVYSWDIKTRELHRVSQQYEDKGFIEEASRTQEAAAKWDGLFVSIINRK